ncbi:MAG: single-stranded-DNA-specific exonuclease RecJ [Planctomycetota bacterium]|nr:single-stranded-DNA-specific exonuclease RecJ [Planctomycetota bacterium]
MDAADRAPDRADDDTWVLPERAAAAADLARRLGVSPVTADLLLRRGYADEGPAREFLEPTLSRLLDPEGLPGMQAGADRLAAAVRAGEKVLLFGDYDVDGTTGAVVLHEVLTALGGQVEVHIPDRGEGYGLNAPRLERAAAEGVRVVVSIDNGIAALDEAELLAARGIDLVVADHHTMGERLPRAAALIHPRLPGSTYANPHLCGAGVAFKLAWAVAARLGANGKPTRAMADVLLRCLAFVALGTVADVVPLVGENRVIVRFGLKALRARVLPGVDALLEVGKVTDDVGTHEVAFRLAPRLNAAGRMGVARRAFDLLVTRDAAQARALARELDEENDRRRAVQDEVFRAACAAVEAAYGSAPLRAPGIVVWGEGWPHGVVGIVAAKLTETYSRPALVAGVEGGVAKGSGRTCGGVDLLASLEPARGLFQRMGGHQAAVGFTADPARLEAVRGAFEAGIAASLGLAADTPGAEVAARLEGYEVVADAEVRLEEVSRQLVDELERLSPFGAGNAEPLFAARAVTLAGEPRPMGKKNEHLAFHVRQGDHVFRAVAFSRPELVQTLRERARPGPGGPAAFDLAFRPRLNRWNGEARLELELKAIRF